MAQTIIPLLPQSQRIIKSYELLFNTPQWSDFQTDDEKAALAGGVAADDVDQELGLVIYPKNEFSFTGTWRCQQCQAEQMGDAGQFCALCLTRASLPLEPPKDEEAGVKGELL